MFKKLTISSLAMLLIAAFTFVSCDSDDDSIGKPTITIKEIGEGNHDHDAHKKIRVVASGDHDHDHGHEGAKKGTAHVGGKLHLTAAITAPAKIEKITIKLHKEEHKSVLRKESTSHKHEQTFEYTEDKGKLNIEFHKDLQLDTLLEVGKYDFEIVVYDQKGEKADADAELELKAEEKK